MARRVIDLTIDKLVHGGCGLARTATGVVFVSGAAPGERVRAVITGRRAGTDFADAIEIVEPSPARRTPPCPFAGSCGGCDWQHLAYDAQVAAKRDIVIDCLRRLGRLKEIPPPEVVASPEWGYRMRTQIKVDRARQVTGFFRRSSNEVIAVDRCPLLCDGLNALLGNRAGILAATSSQVAQVKATEGDAVASQPVIDGVTVPETEVRVGDRRFPVRGDSFFQSNRHLLETLGTWAAPAIGNGDLLWDLYGGVGFFSVMLGPAFRRGILVEGVDAQVTAARRTFAVNGLSHLSAVCAKAEDFLASVSERPDCCIVDPPRPGLTPVVREAIGRSRPRTLVYISCNPATLARDAGYLVNTCGYRVERTAVFDLYPQTHHIEVGMVLAGG